MRESYQAAVISDTHGILRNEVVEVIKGCDVILHGGDFDNKKVLEDLEQMGQLYAVRGNNDWDLGDKLPPFLDFTFYGLHFYMVHDKNDIPKDLSNIDVMIYGHSHKYEERHENGRLILNPGGCGRERFRLPLTMAVLDIYPASKDVKVTRIDIPGSRDSAIKEKMPARDMRKIISSVIKDMDRGKKIDVIAVRNNISRELAEQICRIYVTHPGVNADGILNKMEASNLL